MARYLNFLVVEESYSFGEGKTTKCLKHSGFSLGKIGMATMIGGYKILQEPYDKFEINISIISPCVIIVSFKKHNGREKIWIVTPKFL